MVRLEDLDLVIPRLQVRSDPIPQENNVGKKDAILEMIEEMVEEDNEAEVSRVPI